MTVQEKTSADEQQMKAFEAVVLQTKQINNDIIAVNVRLEQSHEIGAKASQEAIRLFGTDNIDELKKEFFRRTEANKTAVVAQGEKIAERAEQVAEINRLLSA